MPRRARLAVAEVPWHIIQRGNNRCACFYAEDDFQFYLEVLDEQATKYGCAIHAYVLMTNHVHLLLTPERTNSVAAMMKGLGQRYVQYVNRTYRRSGTLWEGRFKSCLAQSEEYVLHCYRYIELNPVRAGMVSRPDQYRWSSHRANAYGEIDSIIVPHTEYCRLGCNAMDQRSRYRNLFNGHVDTVVIEKIRGATSGNFVLGSEHFAEGIAAALARRVVRGKSGRPKAKGEKR